MKKQMKNEIGITLVALIVSIIILLILAGVGITTLTQPDLFAKAIEAKEITKDTQIDENNTLSKYDNQINRIISTRDTVTINKEEYNLLKNNTTYTYEETIVGKWNDGKNLYRKIYHKDIINAGSTVLETNSTTIFPVKIDVTYQQSDNSFVSATGNITLWYNTTLNEIGFWTNLNNVRNVTGFLYYTK